MSTEAPEPEGDRVGFSRRRSGRCGHEDLLPMRRRADAGRGVDGQADVPDVRERRMAAVDPDTHAYLEIVGPGVVDERPLDGHRRLDSRRGALEDREELVG